MLSVKKLGYLPELIPKDNCTYENISTIKGLRNKLILKEMTFIEHVCSENHINYAFIKGIYEAYDLYDNINDRQFGDLDLLVSKADAQLLVKILIENGYYASADFKNKEILEENLNYQHAIHLIPMRKSISSLMELIIEIHLVLDTSWYNQPEGKNNNLTEYILEHVQKSEIDKFEFNTLDIEDRLIISMHHFSRHLLSEISFVAYGNSRDLFNVKTLIDAVLLWNKYSHVIDKNKLYERIELYGFRDSVKLANKFINLACGFNILEDCCLNSLLSYRAKVWEHNIYEQLIYNLEDIHIFENKYEDYYKNVIKGCLEKNVSFSCLKNYTEESIIIDNNKSSLTKQRFGTCLRNNFIINSQNIKSHIRLKWDVKYLYLNINVTDNILKFHGGENSWSDSVVVYLYNPAFSQSKNNAVTSILFIPSIRKDNSLYILANYCGENWDSKNGKIFNLTENEYEIALTNTGYTMNIKLSWNKLNFDISQLTFFGMDIAINNVDSNDEVIDSTICWSNILPSYYMPAKFGIVYLS